MRCVSLIDFMREGLNIFKESKVVRKSKGDQHIHLCVKLLVLLFYSDLRLIFN